MSLELHHTVDYLQPISSLGYNPIHRNEVGVLLCIYCELDGSAPLSTIEGGKVDPTLVRNKPVLSTRP